jgi:hypothetical protein
MLYSVTLPQFEGIIALDSVIQLHFSVNRGISHTVYILPQQNSQPHMSSLNMHEIIAMAYHFQGWPYRWVTWAVTQGIKPACIFQRLLMLYFIPK